MTENFSLNFKHCLGFKRISISQYYKYQIYASLAFIIVVIVIGVPMWWKTTEVYRVSLPNSGIRNLKTTSIRVSCQIGIYTFNPERSSLLVEELKKQFENEEFFNVQFERIINVSDANTARTPVALERLIKKTFTLNAGDFLFFEWPNLKDDILLTTERSGLITKDTTSSQIGALLKGHILQTTKINSLIAGDERLGYQSTPPQPKYDVMISVINPRPDLMDIHWDVKVSSEMYLSPYLHHLRNISEYSLKTQWKFQVPLDFQLEQIRDSSILGRHYALTEDALPHIITSIEKSLGSGITDNPCINLVLYIPPCDIAPLHIYKKSGDKSRPNDIDAFISEKWGSVVFHNPPEELCKRSNEHGTKIHFDISSRHIMQIFLAHLMILTDTTVPINMPGVKMTEIDEIAPKSWEYDVYVRNTCIKYLTTTMQTLQSLVQLLGAISYIVINDEVGLAINDAFGKINVAQEHLGRNELMLATENARMAFIASEQAFFDASLLAQLYFPDEQKYAIYIPLFLPIMVPVISSLAMIKKYYFGQNQNGGKQKTN